MLRKLTIGAFFLALLGSIVWAASKPGWDSFAGVAAALAGLLGSFFLGRDSAPEQSQHVENGGVGIQAGRDISAGSIKVGKK
ncbi:MAG: hypothetical protein QM702_26135 [Rubrivivax sp.]